VTAIAQASRTFDAQLARDLEIVFDRVYYETQAGVTFDSRDAAPRHYLEEGAMAGYDPNRLFDTAFYVSQSTDILSWETNPLVHFLQVGAREGRDPSPYFDVEHYYDQAPAFREYGVNPLVHYLAHAADGLACSPNSVFSDDFYLAVYRECGKDGETPLEHYLRVGCRAGRWMSDVHRRAFSGITPALKRPLLRSARERDLLAFFVTGQQAANLAVAAQGFLEDFELQAVLVAATGDDADELRDRPDVTVIADHFDGNMVSEPALRLLAASLAAARPTFAVTDMPLAVGPLRSAGARVYGLGMPHEKGRLGEWASVGADRLFLTWRAPFRRMKSDACPTRIAVRAMPRGCSRESGAADSARALLEVVDRDRQVRALAADTQPTRRVLVPCVDWWVSGVNTALQAIGTELVRLGWDVEILFTGDEQAVIDSACGGTRLPELPFRTLEHDQGGPEGVWTALIDELHRAAPCILFTSYDFVANSIAPALPDDVGVVLWAQADDSDYYEQAYRLGPYCNAVVAVSSDIRNKICDLNPKLAARTHVIHNSAAFERDIVSDKAMNPDKLTIAYAGRLVQYQKRVFDYIDLADALEQLRTPFVTRLIGEFSPHDPALEQRFRKRADRHLRNGSIELVGRLSRSQIMEELERNDFFVLLSDFEGFPLGLVEAMACGCIPVVADMESGVSEIITPGENGVIVHGRDYSEWAEILTNLWANPEQAAALSARAREDLRESFVVERVASQFDQVLQTIAEEASQRTFERPTSLNWGPHRSATGDVLPPPFLYRPALPTARG
jgi:glycosyltransferase involved in cell wall biosynthesis